MQALLGRASAQLEMLLDYFLPASFADDREMRQRARMFLLSHFFGPFLGNVIPLYLYLFVDENPGAPLLILTASISWYWTFPWMLKRTGKYEVLCLVSVQNLLFATLWGCYWYGGVSSPFLPWLATVPLLAFFYLRPGKKELAWVIGLFSMNLAVFYGQYFSGNAFPDQVPLGSLEVIGIISILSASIYVSMMALYYARIVASQSDLELEVKKHVATAAELRNAIGEAERADAAKSEFLARMSHELRTPLNAVIGYSQILLEDAVLEGDKQTVEDLGRIHAAGQNLLQLVSNLLDISKIEAGKMELFIQPTPAADLVGQVVDRFRSAAEANQVDLSLTVEGELGTIDCDANMVRQVVAQVMDNATKFTRDGSIRVTARRVPAAAGDQIVIAVRDTGPGIDADTVRDLFEQFHAGRDETGTKYGGAGLGLPLAKKMSRLIGGDITVESAPGAGSCFTITLPAIAPEAAPLAGQGSPDVAADRPAAARGGVGDAAERAGESYLERAGAVAHA